MLSPSMKRELGLFTMLAISFAGTILASRYSLYAGAAVGTIALLIDYIITQKTIEKAIEEAVEEAVEESVIYSGGFAPGLFG